MNIDLQNNTLYHTVDQDNNRIPAFVLWYAKNDNNEWNWELGLPHTEKYYQHTDLTVLLKSTLQHILELTPTTLNQLEQLALITQKYATDNPPYTTETALSCTVHENGELSWRTELVSGISIHRTSEHTDLNICLENFMKT